MRYNSRLDLSTSLIYSCRVETRALYLGGQKADDMHYLYQGWQPLISQICA